MNQFVQYENSADFWKASDRRIYLYNHMICAVTGWSRYIYNLQTSHRRRVCKIQPLILSQTLGQDRLAALGNHRLEGFVETHYCKSIEETQDKRVR